MSYAFKQLLFCTDFSQNANFAFDFAADLALRYEAEALHVLHVLPAPAAQFWKGYVNEVENIDERTRKELDAHLAAYEQRTPPGRSFKAVVRFGKPEEEILSYARDLPADLIVIGRQGHGSIFFGNVAARVARNAECPVLVIPLSFKKRQPNQPHPTP